MKPVVCKGVEFESIYQLCKHFKIKSHAYTSMKKKGVPIEDYIDMRDSLQFRGEQYTYLIDFCKKYNLSYTAVVPYFYEGYTLTQLYYGKHKRGEKPLSVKKYDTTTRLNTIRDDIMYNGILYPRLYDICREHDVMVQTFRKRLSYDWTMDEALEVVCREGTSYKKFKKETRGRKKGQSNKFSFRGNTFNSFSAACEFYKVPTSKSRIRKNNGEDLEDIFINKPSSFW